MKVPLHPCHVQLSQKERGVGVATAFHGQKGHAGRSKPKIPYDVIGIETIVQFSKYLRGNKVLPLKGGSQM